MPSRQKFQVHERDSQVTCLSELSLKLPYEELFDATDGFSPQLRIGGGSCGVVYRGSLENGSLVAIRRLSASLTTCFDAEIRVLSRFRHPNLVILLGYCVRGSDLYLVNEYMEGGSYSAALHRCRADCVPFPWYARLSVLLDVASGLSHLAESPITALYRNLSSKSVLLNEHGVAKICDFGLSTLTRPSKAPRMFGLSAQDRSATSGSVSSELLSFGQLIIESLYCGDAKSSSSRVDHSAAWPPQIFSELLQLAQLCIHSRGSTDGERAAGLSFSTLSGRSGLGGVVERLTQLKHASAGIISSYIQGSLGPSTSLSLRSMQEHADIGSLYLRSMFPLNTFEAVLSEKGELSRGTLDQSGLNVFDSMLPDSTLRLTVSRKHLEFTLVSSLVGRKLDECRVWEVVNHSINPVRVVFENLSPEPPFSSSANATRRVSGLSLTLKKGDSTQLLDQARIEFLAVLKTPGDKNHERGRSARETASQYETIAVFFVDPHNIVPAENSRFSTASSYHQGLGYSLVAPSSEVAAFSHADLPISVGRAFQDGRFWGCLETRSLARVSRRHCSISKGSGMSLVVKCESPNGMMLQYGADAQSSSHANERVIEKNLLQGESFEIQRYPVTLFLVNPDVMLLLQSQSDQTVPAYRRVPESIGGHARSVSRLLEAALTSARSCGRGLSSIDRFSFEPCGGPENGRSKLESIDEAVVSRFGGS